ncbi:MAG: Nramp family divalent metal transporter [Actinobacteria bacterium]|nr:Nramp family divalent metal transporter [Actinomycetota bacterium]
MAREKRLTKKNLLLMLSVLGPGIIVSLVDNDAGGIATYSVAGAKYGYAIIWVMIPTLVLLYMVQEMNARMGIVTGKGLAALIRERFSLRLTAAIMVAVMVANFANTIGEFAGVAASSQLFGIPSYISVPVAAAGVWFLVLKGSYRRVEKIFLLVGGIYVCYIISMFLAKPDWLEVAKGTFIPSGQLNASWIIMVITVIGTTIAPWMQFYQQASVVDKGLDKKDLVFERIDTAVGNVFLFIAAFAIIVCCAAAFFNKPGVGATQITSAEQAALGLAPIAGKYASYLFAAGLLFASLFAASVLPLSSAYSVCEAFGWESGIDRSFSEAPKFYWTYTLFIAGGALLVMIPNIPLITVMVISQTINGVLLPIIVTCMLMIIKDRDIMGKYVNGDRYQVAAWICVVILYILDLWLVISSIFPIGW